MTALTERFYEPVKTGLAREWNSDQIEEEEFEWNDLSIYGVRERGKCGGRVLATDLRLSRERADLLCDLLEEIRRELLSRVGIAA